MEAWKHRNIETWKHGIRESQGITRNHMESHVSPVAHGSMESNGMTTQSLIIV